MARELLSTVTVRAPATTANLGPGYDTLGLALDLWNELTVSLAQDFIVDIEGEGEGELPKDSRNIIVKGVELTFETFGATVPPLHYHCNNKIPQGKGLGSSGAAAVSGVFAGFCLLKKEISLSQVLDLAVILEGHPDNCAPAIFGGMQITGYSSADVGQPDDSRQKHSTSKCFSSSVKVPPNLSCSLFVPAFSQLTVSARATLNDTVSRADGVFNIARTALLVNAFASGDLGPLSVGMQDRFHQPQRAAEQCPHLWPLMVAALDAGARGSCLSGAGPSVIALIEDLPEEGNKCDKAKLVAAALSRKADELNLEGVTLILKPTVKGVYTV